MRIGIAVLVLGLSLGCAGVPCPEDDVECQRAKLAQALVIADEVLDVVEAIVPIEEVE